MALVGIEVVTHVSEPDALTTRPPPCAFSVFYLKVFEEIRWISLIGSLYHNCNPGKS